MSIKSDIIELALLLALRTGSWKLLSSRTDEILPQKTHFQLGFGYTRCERLFRFPLRHLKYRDINCSKWLEHFFSEFHVVISTRNVLRSLPLLIDVFDYYDSLFFIGKFPKMTSLLNSGSSLLEKMEVRLNFERGQTCLRYALSQRFLSAAVL